MPKGFSFSDRDKGYKRLQRQYKDVAKDQPYVKAGVLESAGIEPGSGLTVAQVATFNEFGTERMPERSFLRSMQKSKAGEIREFIKRLGDGMLTDPRQKLNLLGLKLVDLIKAQIQNGDYAPNSPRTIEIKGSSRPLIDTGQMRNSIQHVVVEKR